MDVNPRSFHKSSSSQLKRFTGLPFQQKTKIHYSSRPIRITIKMARDEQKESQHPESSKNDHQTSKEPDSNNPILRHVIDIYDAVWLSATVQQRGCDPRVGPRSGKRMDEI